MLTIDGKEYDEKKMSDKGRIAFAQLQHIARKQSSLNLELQNMIILQNHHEAILKKELPKEEKK
jgi:hypothetical protein